MVRVTNESPVAPLESEGVRVSKLAASEFAELRALRESATSFTAFRKQLSLSAKDADALLRGLQPDPETAHRLGAILHAIRAVPRPRPQDFGFAEDPRPSGLPTKGGPGHKQRFQRTMAKLVKQAGSR